MSFRDPSGRFVQSSGSLVETLVVNAVLSGIISIAFDLAFTKKDTGAILGSAFFSAVFGAIGGLAGTGATAAVSKGLSAIGARFGSTAVSFLIRNGLAHFTIAFLKAGIATGLSLSSAYVDILRGATSGSEIPSPERIRQVAFQVFWVNFFLELLFISSSGRSAFNESAIEVLASPNASKYELELNRTTQDSYTSSLAVAS